MFTPVSCLGERIQGFLTLTRTGMRFDGVDSGRGWLGGPSLAVEVVG